MGVIHIENTDATFKFLLEVSKFYKCSKYSNGGCIYFETNGHSVISRNCFDSNHLLLSSDIFTGVNFYIKISKDNSNLNLLLDCSMQNSGNPSQIGESTLRLYFGNITFSNSNTSYSKIKYISILDINRGNPRNLIKYSNFNDNVDMDPGNDPAAYVAKSSEINNCNFFNNKAKHLLKFANAGSTVNHCSFFNNAIDGYYIYSTYTSYQIYVKYCYIDDPFSTTSNVQISNHILDKFTNKFDMSNCFQFIERIAGIQSPPIRFPKTAIANVVSLSLKR